MHKHAVVIGGSIAGKLVATVLSDHFQKVTIIEADQEYAEKSPRKRVPQSYHPHVLLKKGERVINELFPHFFDELLENGSIPVNFMNLKKESSYGREMPHDLENLLLLFRRFCSNQLIGFYGIKYGYLP